MMNYACAALKRLPMCCTSRKQVARRKPQNNPTVLQSSLADGLYANEVGSQVNFGRTLPIFRMNELTRREAQNSIENLFHRNVARQRSSFKLWRLWIWSRVWRLGMTVVMSSGYWTTAKNNKLNRPLLQVKCATRATEQISTEMILTIQRHWIWWRRLKCVIVAIYSVGLSIRSYKWGWATASNGNRSTRLQMA